MTIFVTNTLLKGVILLNDDVTFHKFVETIRIMSI